MEKFRKDFSFLAQADAPAYFDNACQTLRPRQVMDAMADYYENYPACAGRSGHALGEMVTKKIAEARATVAGFIGAKKAEEIIFTRNATEAINLVAHSLIFKEGDIILTTDKEHNSNLLPWMRLASARGLRHEIIATEDDGTIDLKKFEEMVKSLHPGLIAMGLTSNLDGATIPAKEMIKIAHKNDSMVLLDAAQASAHRTINVRDLDVDFLAFSGHKMLGPSGTGVLYGKYNLLEKLEPFILGGGTVSSSTYKDYDLLPPPERFEAGLQDYAGIIGFAAAVKYLEEAGLKNIAAKERELNAFITGELLKLPKLKIIGPEDAALRGGIISFYVPGVESHQIMMLLDKAGICVRSGQFCVHSWFSARGIKDAVRASVYFYNTMEEAEKFVREMKRIAKIF